MNGSAGTTLDICHVCGKDAMDVPLVPDTDVGKGQWICGACWLLRMENDNDVRFFLATIDRQIPAVEKLTRTDFHHTIAEWRAAVKSLKTIRDMRRFADGCSKWHSGPGIDMEQAALITHANISCVVQEFGWRWWMRLKWWWAIGATTSETFYT